MEVMVSSDGPTSWTMSRAHQALATVRRARSGEASAATVIASREVTGFCTEYPYFVRKFRTWACNREEGGGRRSVNPIDLAQAAELPTRIP